MTRGWASSYRTTWITVMTENVQEPAIFSPSPGSFTPGQERNSPSQLSVTVGRFPYFFFLSFPQKTCSDELSSTGAQFQSSSRTLLPERSPRRV